MTANHRKAVGAKTAWLRIRISGSQPVGVRGPQARFKSFRKPISEAAPYEPRFVRRSGENSSGRQNLLQRSIVSAPESGRSSLHFGSSWIVPVEKSFTVWRAVGSSGLQGVKIVGRNGCVVQCRRQQHAVDAQVSQMLQVGDRSNPATRNHRYVGEVASGAST